MKRLKSTIKRKKKQIPTVWTGHNELILSDIRLTGVRIYHDASTSGALGLGWHASGGREGHLLYQHWKMCNADVSNALIYFWQLLLFDQFSGMSVSNSSCLLNLPFSCQPSAFPVKTTIKLLFVFLFFFLLVSLIFYILFPIIALSPLHTSQPIHLSDFVRQVFNLSYRSE